jgi:tetratricopeptide (TPR) repeat protein
VIALFLLANALAAMGADLDLARDRQDRAALQKLAAELGAAADKSPKDPDAQYRAALAASYVAEVALEVRDKPAAQKAAESGIRFAERALALKPAVSEYHRVLGTLCGQFIPAGGVLAGLSYGRRAKDAITKALELDPKSAKNWMARGVGNYYLPPALGGGPDVAISDFQKAISLDAKSADAYVWLGLTYRKRQRNADARKAFQKALELNPRRVWAKEQLGKTPPS